MQKATASFLFLLILGMLMSACTFDNTPRRSLSELRAALLSHDADRALRYVDVDSVVDCMVRDAFLKYETKSGNPLEALGIRASKEAAAIIMPQVKELLRDQLKKAITSPDEEGYFGDIRRASVWYLNIRVEGDEAVGEPKGKSDIRFRMARTEGGYWRIVEIVRTR